MPANRGNGVRFGAHELAGAVADVGVLLPIAVALIVANGLSATAVLLPAGLLYIAVALLYGLPIPVQPLKAFGAIAIAKDLGSDEIAAGALLMGVIFLILGRTGLIDLAARAFPKPLIRGVQITVGLLFLKIAWGLVADPPAAFDEHGLGTAAAAALALVALALLLALRKAAISLVLVAVGAAVMLVQGGGDLALGPSAIALPHLDADVLLTAFTVLVIPQLPLSFANSCLATADAARTYFGERAQAIRPGRLAMSLGSANVFAGALSGMPVCHGAGGLTAHHAFGARTGGAPLVMGVALVTLALALGSGLAVLLTAFPLPILAALLAGAGLLHIALARDLEGARDVALALLVAGVGFLVNLAVGLALGLALWWLPQALRARRSRLVGCA
ncbi:MAG TPA: putative sulfate/molybdate transporter [Thermoleophilaceae bacterium]|nr:putative sulfate/molybdate transporter [Thermoleophilaceae bacterium]